MNATPLDVFTRQYRKARTARQITNGFTNLPVPVLADPKVEDSRRVVTANGEARESTENCDLMGEGSSMEDSRGGQNQFSSPCPVLTHTSSGIGRDSLSGEENEFRGASGNGFDPFLADAPRLAAGNSAQGDPATSVFRGEFVDGLPVILPTCSTARSTSLQIRVGWRDIWFGEQGKIIGCPVWSAVNRNGSGCFVVCRDELYYPGIAQIPLPAEVQIFIGHFDNFMGPRFLRPLFFWPFTFQIELPA